MVAYLLWFFHKIYENESHKHAFFSHELKTKIRVLKTDPRLVASRMRIRYMRMRAMCGHNFSGNAKLIRATEKHVATFLQAKKQPGSPQCPQILPVKGRDRRDLGAKEEPGKEHAVVFHMTSSSAEEVIAFFLNLQ